MTDSRHLLLVLVAATLVSAQSSDWQQAVWREPQVRYLLADMCLGGGDRLYRQYATAAEKDPDSVEAIRLWDAGVRVVNTNEFERKWVANPHGKDGRVMRIVHRGSDRTITGDEVLLTSDFSFRQASIRVMLADLSLGRSASFYQDRRADPNVAEALRRWAAGVRVLNLDWFEARGEGPQRRVVYRGTDKPIDGALVRLNSDLPYPETNVRYFMADIALGGSIDFYRGAAEAAHEMGCLEAVRRTEEGYKIANLDQFERKKVNGQTLITRKSSDKRISGMEVRLSSDQANPPSAIPNPQSHSSAASPISEQDVFDIVDAGAVGDGQTDCTAAIQKAIDAAAVRGGVVLVPVGRFLVTGNLVLKMGVHLAGMNEAPQSWEPATGSILLPTAGRGHEEGPAFIEMRSSTSLKGLTIYYLEQKVDDIRPYPWTIQMRADPAVAGEVSFDSTVENVTLINSYNGIRTGPTENGRHRLFQINGCVLRRGILVEGTGDIGRIENVQFHSHFWANKAFEGNWNKVFAFMQQNLEAFVFGRTDWEYVNNTFVFPAQVGYRFIESKGTSWGGSCNGQFSGIGADACDTCVLVESLQPQGLLITNGQFNAHQIGRSTQVVVEPGCSGNIRFVNCGFWGPVLHNAVLRGHSFVSFSDCYFSNDNQKDPGYSIVAETGKLQVQDSTFDARSRQRKPGNAWTEADVRNQPGSIHLKPGVQHAILHGNNGYYGVNIKNEIGGKAIISENEPYAPDKE